MFYFNFSPLQQKLRLFHVESDKNTGNTRSHKISGVTAEDVNSSSMVGTRYIRSLFKFSDSAAHILQLLIRDRHQKKIDIFLHTNQP